MLRIRFVLALFISVQLNAQPTFHHNGPADEREKYYAFIHANIITDYQSELHDATLIIREGKIESVGNNITIPASAVVIDLKGNFIYPSFIDLISDYGLQVKKNNSPQGIRPPQYESDKSGAFNWNQAIHPEINAADLFEVQEEQAKALRDLGFGVVCTHEQDGIIRGTGALVMLGEERANEMVVKQNAASYYSFNKGTSTQAYPSSLMGSIALIRQTYYDAEWYKQGGNKQQTNLSLDALNQSLQLPQIFSVNDVYSCLRADKIGDEFNIKYIIKGDGDEYQRLTDIKATNDAFIIPLHFPLAYDVIDPYDAQFIPLENLMHWEQAPSNPGLLEKAGVDFAITSADLKDKKDFWKNLLKAIAYGLSETEALKSLTYTPANLLGVYNITGSIAVGKLANFIICSDSLFSTNNIIFQNWVNGVAYNVNSFDMKDIRGNYALSIASLPQLNLKIEGKLYHPEASIAMDDKEHLKVSVERKDELITLSFAYPHDTSKTVYRLSGYLKVDDLDGTAQLPDGSWSTWNATFSSAYVPKPDSAKKELPKNEGTVLYPFVGYGNAVIPTQQNFLFKNATVWTNESEGIVPNEDVLITNGKITQLGKNLSAPTGTVVIDATGKHLTSGIIDEHSHIAISEGVNEGSYSVTSEVRIGDVVNASDINIYRQLSGGVTCSHLLHGSANTIGGQTQLIKLRWGYAPEAMKFDGWPGFIKFALGENVKQANWGDLYNVRFPQTRMGVEQTIYDAFIRAKDYELSLQKYNSLSSKDKPGALAPRRDLQLDALDEILNGKRFITCHSYVQSEINMLLHLSDSLHFQMNTFTHILEGYKVADKMKEHHVYASTFADWWSYKFEVYDAIPYNSAILTKVGVVTAVNSDDAEMARRLNQEAAKSIKYGGLSEEEAWKLCTLNPAKMLHVDDQVGSIKVGKDADVVLWSDDPLSIYAKCEMTLVDGIRFYSLEDDQKHQDFINAERNRIVNKMIQAKKNGEPTQPVGVTFNQEWDCETLTDGSNVGK